jgi:hypothetical protein
MKKEEVNKLLEKIIEETEIKLEILKLNNKFLTSQTVSGKTSLEGALGQIQADIKYLEDYLAFLTREQRSLK